MNRRDFIILAGGALGTRPVGALAQARPVPLVGMLFPGGTEGPFSIDSTTAFFEGLHQEGYDEGAILLSNTGTRTDISNDLLPSLKNS